MIKYFIGISIALLLLTGYSAAAENACVGCHTMVGATSGIINDWKQSKHALNNVTCDKCHEAAEGDKDAINHNGFLITITPSPKDCGKCHPERVNQFESGKHSLGWTKMVVSARYMDIPNDKMRSSMCEGCHSIGKVYPDGGTGKCYSCHTRHVFSKDEARQPEACETCHMGLDHEQIEYYKKSKHGMIQEMNRTDSRAPSCMTCHMDGGTHDVSQGITIGTVSQGAFISNKSSGNDNVKDDNGITMRAITQEQFDINRQKMMSICIRCHSSEFARSALENADVIKAQADKKVGDAITIIEGLYKDGLLDPMPENRPPNPVTGKNLTLTGQQTYSNTSGIEAEFFETYKYALIHSWKGAYHMNPDYAHWYGWAQLNLDLDRIKSEERSLRKIAELEKENNAKSTSGFEAVYAFSVTIVCLILVRIRRN